MFRRPISVQTERKTWCDVKRNFFMQIEIFQQQMTTNCSFLEAKKIKKLTYKICNGFKSNLENVIKRDESYLTEERNVSVLFTEKGHV